MYHLTAKVIFERSSNKTRSFVNTSNSNKCEHEDTTYSGRTDNVFSKTDQFIHAGTIEPYNSKLIKNEKSYMLFTLKADGFDALPSELDVETQLVCGVGNIRAKGNEFVTGRKTKSSKQTDKSDNRFGKIYCYQHHKEYATGSTGYFLFRFPFQELSYIYHSTSNEGVKLKIEKVIENLTVPNEERIFFRYQSHLAPGTLLLKYMEIMYDQIMFVKQDHVLTTLLEKTSEKLGLDFCDNEAIHFLNQSIELLRRDLSSLYYPSLWALVNHLGIEPKGELLKVLTKNYKFEPELLKNKEIEQKYFNYAQGKLVLEYLVHYPLQQEQLAQILTQYTIKISSNKKSQTIDYINIEDFDNKVIIEEILSNPYMIFENYIDGKGIPLLFEDIDWGEKSRLGASFDHLNLNRLRAIVVDYIKRQQNSSGNVWVSFEEVQEYMLDKLCHLDGQCDNLMNNSGIYSVEKLLSSKTFVEYFDVDFKKKYLTSKKLSSEEETIRNIVLSKLNTKKLPDISLLNKMEELDFVFVSGVAGAGKSYALCQYLNSICNLYDFQVLSPTGKSANVLRDKIDTIEEFCDIKNHLLNSSNKIATAHQYLVNQGFWNHELFTLCEPKNISQNNLDILVVDEISMFDLELLYLVLKSTNAKKIIFLGDIKQLQPIGYGSIAHSIYNYLKHNNSPSLVELTESRRAKEGAKFIDMSLLLREDDYDVSKISEYLNVKDETIETSYFKDSSELTMQLQKIFENSFFQSTFRENILELGSISNIDKLQIITPNNIGKYGTYSINNLIKSQLGNEYTYNKVSDRLKYIKLTNNNKTGVVNGMFGVSDNEGHIEFENNETEWYKSEAHNLGYAISIHKSQGSGFENVVLIIPESELFNLTKELIYTALTRASKKLYILIHDNQKDIFSKLPAQTQRNMGVFDTDKLLWDKQVQNGLAVYEYFRKYRTKQDLYTGLLLNTLKNIHTQDTRYLYNGIFKIGYTQLNLENYKNKYTDKI